MKLLAIVGTRPEAIKTLPVVREARRRGVPIVLVSTGQHREMIRPLFELFGCPPDHDLDLMQPNQSLGSLTARALTALGEVLAAEAPGAVLVQGDTTTAFAGALAAFYARIPVAHVEAGLRTGDLAHPFPEEFNRRAIDQFARWLFPPTASAAEAIAAEGLPAPGDPLARVLVTGNTGIDALRFAAETVRLDPPRGEALDRARTHKTAGGRLVLVTGHRRENFGAPLENVCRGLREVADARPDLILLYPVHLNPNVRGPVGELLGGHPRILLAPPMDYLPFVSAMTLADVIVTDSGGVQEEAPALGVPVLVTRERTERPEAVAAGGARLVGSDRARLVRELGELLDHRAIREAMARARSPYGDGQAAARVVGCLLGDSVEPFAG
ncbi:MAG: UDP-N-acetylglucosamine 2-epimerase (non-hydrolyzing) [Sumerlaeia bacterium]